MRSEARRPRATAPWPLVGLVVLAFGARPGVWFVDPAGNDRNPGTEDRPWRTLQKAADAAKPGDRVLVRKGITGAKGEASVEKDPLFVDPDKGDYHLQLNSPAINAGRDKGAPAEDLEGFPRPYGGGFDLACCEAHPKGAKPPPRK